MKDADGFFGESLVQIDPLQDMQFLTPVKDAGAQRLHYISADCRVTSWIIDPLTNYYASMQHYAPTGQVNKGYVESQVFVEYNNTGIFTDSSTYSVLDITSQLASDVYINARYYRLRVVGRQSASAPGDPYSFRVKMQVVRFLATY